MEDWKEAHDKAKEYIAALEEMNEKLRDRCIAEVKERQALQEMIYAPPRFFI